MIPRLDPTLRLLELSRKHPGGIREKPNSGLGSPWAAEAPRMRIRSEFGFSAGMPNGRECAVLPRKPGGGEEGGCYIVGFSVKLLFEQKFGRLSELVSWRMPSSSGRNTMGDPTANINFARRLIIFPFTPTSFRICFAISSFFRGTEKIMPKPTDIRIQGCNLQYFPVETRLPEIWNRSYNQCGLCTGVDGG